jgi:hypothetical protein
VRRRLSIGAALVLASIALHWTVLWWIDGRLHRPGSEDTPSESVQVALIEPVPVAPPPPAEPPAEPPAPPAPPAKPPPPVAKPKPRVIPPPARPAPGPTAITPEDPPPPRELIPLPPDAIADPSLVQAPEQAPGAGREPVVGDAPAAGEAPPTGDAKTPPAAGRPRPAASALPSGPEGAVATRAVPKTAAPAPDAKATKLFYGKPLPLPPAGQWQFRVYYGEYRNNHQLATLDYLIEHDGRKYHLRTAGRAVGLTSLFYSGVLTQDSAGRLSENGLAPERYAEKRGDRPERSLSVDYASRRVAFAGKEPADLVDGAQDRLSTLVQLGLMARALPQRFAQGSVIELPELTLGDLEKSRYLSRGDTVLDTENGPLRALHLERTAPRGKDDPKIEIWLGYDQQMLPVRMKVTDVGGRVLDQLLVR